MNEKTHYSAVRFVSFFANHAHWDRPGAMLLTEGVSMRSLVESAVDDVTSLYAVTDSHAYA